jgi:transposase
MAERYLATVPIPIFDEHYSGDWWRAIKRDDEERRKITRRRQEEEEQRQLESRRAYEASLRRGVSQPSLNERHRRSTFS